MSRTTGRKNRKAGFTLLELLLVLVIMLILVGGVSVSISGVLSRMQYRSQVSKVLAIAGIARARAMSTGNMTWLSLNNDTGEIILFEGTRDSEGSLASSIETRTLILPSNILITDIEIEGESAVDDSIIRFYPTGGADAARFVMTLLTNSANQPMQTEIWTNRITGRTKSR